MRNFFNLEKYMEQLEKSTSILQCESVPVPDIGENQNYIFISYAHSDYKKVYADLAVMYHAGVRFWYDRGLNAGKNWDNEVKERISSPKCSGVIFFLSESLFLSRSANMEIDFVCGDQNGIKKNYFCINLTDEQPKGILKSIMRMEDSVLDNAGLDMDRIGTLARAFSDKQTYLYHSEAEHQKKLLEQIATQFDVIEPALKKSCFLLREENGEVIPITQDSFMIGKEARKCHYSLDDTLTSRVHAVISSHETEHSIMDMGTINGTFLNDVKIAPLVPVLLHANDKLTIGSNTFIFLEE
ncbi:MAG: FHA domain-containing protein [Lachnospiraceae bacterium]|nr:FHA domain-containing protein [Lachnospiraceae bacterium]